MVLVRLTKHPRGLAPRTVQKVVIRHAVYKESFRKIAKSVKNLSEDRTPWTGFGQL